MRLIDSLRHARDGYRFSFIHERNMRIHTAIAVIALIVAIVIDLSAIELILMFLAITLVIVSELLNTAIEKTVDLAMPNQHPIAKAAKDCAAAAVLICALFAIAVGIIIVGSHIIGGITWRWTS
ncbi:MAG: diacylglycerol kinase family protein [Paenibacillaceae bacterium]